MDIEGPLVITIENRTSGVLTNFCAFDKEIGVMLPGARKTLSVDEIIIQGQSVVTDYNGLLNGRILSKIKGWCGTGMERVDSGVYEIGVSAMKYDNAKVLWFELQ